MPSPIATVLSIAVAICSPFVIVQTTATDPRVGQVDHIVLLSQALVKGVDECFNPSNTKANNAAKNKLNKLGNTAQSAKSSMISGDSGKLARTAAELETQWNEFFKASPLLARAHCATQRDCMRLGFEGNPKYRNCKPMNGDPHSNVQYIQFEELVDSALPQLIAVLRPRA